MNATEHPGASLGELSNYGYVPTRAVSVVFLVLFATSTVAHLVQAIRYRLWFLIPTAVLCGVGELAGWGARMYSSFDVLNDIAFTVQYGATVVSPTPFLAALFIMTGRLVPKLGQRYSRLSQKQYNRYFLACDIFALTVQSTGGDIASIPNASKNLVDLGEYILLAGVIFQLLVVLAYTMLAGEFIWRYKKNFPISAPKEAEPRARTPRRLWIMIITMAVVTNLLHLRSVYRLDELATGFNGIIFRTEWPFDLFDGAMVVVSMLALNVVHPGKYLVPEMNPVENDLALMERPRPGASVGSIQARSEGSIQVQSV